MALEYSLLWYPATYKILNGAIVWIIWNSCVEKFDKTCGVPLSREPSPNVILGAARQNSTAYRNYALLERWYLVSYVNGCQDSSRYLTVSTKYYLKLSKKLWAKLFPSQDAAFGIHSENTIDLKTYRSAHKKTFT